MKLNLSCADFSFPLLSHSAALKLIALLGVSGVDVGLFAGRSHLRPEKELSTPEKNGAALGRRFKENGLAVADIFLQLHEGFTEFAINQPSAARRKFARQQFIKVLDYAAAAGSRHLTILPGANFPDESYETSLARSAAELEWRVKQAAPMKITVGVEPHLGSITDTPQRTLQLTELVPDLGLTLDYAHFTCMGIADKRIEPLTARATHFHARSARRGRLQCSLKQNAIDFAGVLKALNRHSFKGWIALEYVWIDWEHCNEVDVLSETIKLQRHLIAAAKTTIK